MDEFAELERELMEEQNSSTYSSQQILNLLDKCEVIRADTHSTGGRKITKNIGSTILYIPLLISGLISIPGSFFVIFLPTLDEVGFLVAFPFCFIFFGGLIMTMIGFNGLKDSVGEMIMPDDYEKYVMAVYFNRRRRYIAEVKTILDATNDDIIGDISCVKDISLSKKSKIFCRYHPGEPGEYGSPTSNCFIVSHRRESIRLDKNHWLSDERRIAIAEDWSEKLGVKIGDPLIR
jgi:hypothetical protein